MVSSVENERLQAASPRPAESPARGRRVGDREPDVPPRSLGLPALTLFVGVVVTLVLALLSHAQYTSNEHRLLTLRVRDAGSLVTGSLPATQSTLASAAELANATDGNLAKFRGFVGQAVHGHPPQFASVSLWRLDKPGGPPLAVVGAAPEIAAQPAVAAAFFERTRAKHGLGVTGLLQAARPSIGLAFAAGRYVVYAENPLPKDRRSSLGSSSAFYGLQYAIFLGDKQTEQNLLVSNVSLPMPKPNAAQTIPFGDSAITLAMATPRPLAGTLPRDLPWIIALLGGALSLTAALVTLRLSDRRRAAEGLARRLETIASENRRLFAEQRTIAQTLQHSLLPDVLPQVDGVQASARYEAGERGVEIGGDWYDVIDLGSGRLLLVVGDVSGRGLRAATTMAALRYAIRAYAAQGDSPPEILTKLTHLVSVADTGQLATILCILVDGGRRSLSVTSAGHLPPLLIAGGDGTFVHSELGLPIGVEAGAGYVANEAPMPPGGTLIAFTDGLVETRGETIDQGLERLRSHALRNGEALPDQLQRLVTEVPGGHSEDDIAIVGVRWTS